MKNWKTTLFGTTASISAALIPFFPQYKAPLGAVAAVSGILFSVFSKDSNVTGGTKQQ